MGASKRPNKLMTIESEPFNAATPLSALEFETTPNELFYVRNHFPVPGLSPEQWRLRVEGMVEQPASFSLDELKAMERSSVAMVMECAGNARDQLEPKPPGTPWNHGAVSLGQFEGIPLAKILQAVGLEEGAREIQFVGSDSGEVEPGRVVHYARSLPLKQALRPEVLLAWSMNGQPLPANHGFPLRLVVPGWYGMASVKWLERIVAIEEPFEGYYQRERYVYKESQSQETGPPVTLIKPRALIVSPSQGEYVPAEELIVKGLAWSGQTQIERVEISIDGGASWQPASLQAPATKFEPTRWQLQWTPSESGQFELIARAVVGDGEAQPLTYQWNALGYGNNGAHRVQITVDQAT